jgi:phosphoribosylformylglycinamidine cyclo-ligase
LLDMPRPEGLINSQEADGIGTKVVVSQRTAHYATAALDLIAMAADDPATKGFEPVIVTTNLDVNRLNKKLTPYMKELAQGAISAAKQARVALFGGETAVLGNLVGGYGSPDKNLHFLWSATVHAKGHRERLVDGQEIKPGMALVGLPDYGFRSNGITSVREIARQHHGAAWQRKWIELGEDVVRLGEAVLRPSVIYTPTLVDATGGYDLRVEPKAPIAGAAHITGGGLWGKLSDLLSVSGYGADIESPLNPPEVMKHIQRVSEMSDYDLYGKWHGGQGLVAATAEPDKLIALAADNDIEGAQQIGVVTKQPGIRLRSAAAQKPGRKLTYRT